MATQPVPRPIEGCETCRTGYQTLIDMYKLWYACPNDPGAKGIFEAEREEYEQHHRQSHATEEK